MKKIFVIFALIFSVMTAKAQLASEASIWSEGASDINHSGVFVNPAIGLQCGDVEDDFGIAVNLGYRWHIGSGFNWDVISFGVNTGVSNFTEMLDMRFLSGFRYNTPEILAGKSLYLNCAFGYHFLTDNTDISGFAWEVGGGVNITRKISLGIVYEASKYSDDYWSAKWGIVGLRLGLNF